MRSNGGMSGGLDATGPVALHDTVHRLLRQTPRQLLAHLRFRQVRAGERGPPEPLLAARRGILDSTAQQLRGHALPAAMEALVFLYLDELRAYAEVASYLPPLDFPTAIHATACGRALPAPVGAALLCYYIGLHMLDDVHDDELPPGIEENDASVVALMCVATLPALLLVEGSGWSAPRSVRQRLSAELHCHAHPTMTGQFLDISRSTSCTLAHASEVIFQRNGAIGRVFGRIAAIAAGCSEADIGVAGQAVAYMSMASQVLDDIENMWSRPVSSDAVNRAKTLPLCFVLDARPDLRAGIFELCDDPRPTSHRRLRELLASHGGLHFGLVSMALLRSHAARMLSSIGGRARLGDLEEYLLEATAPAMHPRDDDEPPGRSEAPSRTGEPEGDRHERAPEQASALLEASLQLFHRGQVP
jgi:hypothetical protein